MPEFSSFQLSDTAIGVLVYFAIVNVITFIYFGVDKYKSQIGSRRVRERTLWILSLIGGSLGGLLAMHLFRHKTKKLSFQAVLAIILAIQIGIIYFFMTYQAQ